MTWSFKTFANHNKAIDFMRYAHKIYRKFNIDPAYSTGRLKPNPRGLSIFSTKTAGPFWLYASGEIEAYWLSKVRKCAFYECLWVYHPGKFKQFSHLLVLKRKFKIQDIPSKCVATIHHSGDLRLIINGLNALHCKGTLEPTLRRVNIVPFLKEDKNEIFVVLNRIDEPPAFLMDTSIIQSDRTWMASTNFQHWHPPTCYPFEGGRRFPHQEELPRIEIEPRSVSRNIYDFGIEVFGYPVVKIKKGRGRVKIDAGESLAEVENKDAQLKEQWFSPQVLGRYGHTSKEPLAGRFLKVSVSPNIVIDGLKISAPFYPAIYHGAFACSDELLTKMWMHSAYTLRLCMREFFLDGMKRDRMPWMGDAYQAMLCNFYSFVAKGITERTLTALQTEDPRVTHINGIIDYSLFWVMAIDEYLLYSGDISFCEPLWPKILSLMKSMETMEDSIGFLLADKATWTFIDWAEIDKRGAIAALQMFYIMALLAVSRLSYVCKNREESGRFKCKAEILQKKCRKYFWNSKYGAFVDNYSNGQQGKNISRHANFLSILAGVPLKKQIKPILENVILNKKIPPLYTPGMKFYELKALIQIKQAEIALTEMKKYWGGMLSLGATTFWEAYNPEHSRNEHYAFYGRPFGKSLCHAWGAGLVYLLPAEILGIQPLEMGWKRFSVAPRLGSLKWARATVPTPAGDIEAEVALDKITVKVPKGIAMESLQSKAGHIRHKGPGVVIYENKVR